MGPQTGPQTPQDALPLLNLDWAGLLNSREFKEILVPYLMAVEASLIEAIAEAESTAILYKLQGRLQAIRAVKIAPQTYIAALEAEALAQARRLAQEEEENGRRDTADPAWKRWLRASRD